MHGTDVVFLHNGNVAFIEMHTMRCDRSTAIKKPRLSNPSERSFSICFDRIFDFCLCLMHVNVNLCTKRLCFLCHLFHIVRWACVRRMWGEHNSDAAIRCSVKILVERYVFRKFLVCIRCNADKTARKYSAKPAVSND